MHKTGKLIGGRGYNIIFWSENLSWDNGKNNYSEIAKFDLKVKIKRYDALYTHSHVWNTFVKWKSSFFPVSCETQPCSCVFILVLKNRLKEKLRKYSDKVCTKYEQKKTHPRMNCIKHYIMLLCNIIVLIPALTRGIIYSVIEMNLNSFGPLFWSQWTLDGGAGAAGLGTRLAL